MPRAELTVSVPEGVWIGDVSRRYPDAVFRVVTAFADGGTGVGLAEIETRDVDAVVAAMEDHDTTSSVDVLHAVDDEALVQFETGSPVLLFPLRESGIPLEFPFEIRDGEATWTLRATTDQLRTLREQFSAFGISFTLESIREDPLDTATVLTDRQREVVAAAVEAGYYEVPRRASLTDVADRLGVAKSTCSETLHRAEARIVTEFAERTALLDG